MCKGHLFDEARQVILQITNNVLCSEQRATAKFKTGIIRGYGMADAYPFFQAG
jgi:hypothetical protein